MVSENNLIEKKSFYGRSLKAFILSALFSATTICGMAQDSVTVYSQNKEANSYYSKALDYIKIGNPRNGGSVDSLLKAVDLLEKSVKEDPRFVTAYIELCKTYWLFDFSDPDFPTYIVLAIVWLTVANSTFVILLSICTNVRLTFLKCHTIANT